MKIVDFLLLPTLTLSRVGTGYQLEWGAEAANQPRTRGVQQRRHLLAGRPSERRGLSRRQAHL